MNFAPHPSGRRFIAAMLLAPVLALAAPAVPVAPASETLKIELANGTILHIAGGTRGPATALVSVPNVSRRVAADKALRSFPASPSPASIPSRIVASVRG